MLKPIMIRVVQTYYVEAVGLRKNNSFNSNPFEPTM